MSSENTFRPVTVAPMGTPCGWTAYGETGTKLTCHGDRPAIHILTVSLPVAKAGTALCGYHSPWDATPAEREAVGQPFQTKGEAGAAILAAREAEADPDACAKHPGGFNIPGTAVCVGCEADGTHTMEGPVSADPYAAFVAECAKNPSYEIIGGHPYGRKSGLPIFRNVADNSPGILARHRARMAAEAEAAKAEAEVSGVEILADMLTLSPVAEAVPFDVVKFHKLSAPMIGVLTEVARSRGLVGAWAMRNVVVPGVDRATMRTVAALRVRGLIDAQTNDGNQSGTGGLTDYVLTEAGYGVAEAIGCPVVDLPTDAEAIAAVVGSHTEADCETGCEVIIARGVAMLPAGGDVCYGCGSIFTRPNGQLHPSLYVISEAVAARHQMKGN